MRMPDVEDFTDEALIQIWERAKDPENLTDFEQEVVAEMERRGTDF
jgi:hypothetical protein